VVLDLGSGGGIDVLLSAKRVSPGGKAYGLDMTDEMLALAEKNKAEEGAENVEFLKGHIEDVPLPEEHVDVVISNCVINLSTDKPKVISEAYRVLKPGGRFAVSDMVFLGDKDRLPDDLVRSMEAWSGCVSGALEKDEYEGLLREAGFEDVSVEVTHTYAEEFVEASGCCGGSGCCGDTAATEVPLASAFIRGRKPVGGVS
jgi:SAM-dependent methyltransferase